MCHKVTKADKWNSKQPKIPIVVGQIVENESEKYILQSVGKDKDGQDYALWYSQEIKPLHLLDKITKGPKEWTYTRSYECSEAHCITEKYLTTLNADYHPV